MKIVVSGIFFVLFLVSVFTGAFNVQSAKVNASSRGETVQTAGTDWWPMFHHDPSHTGASTSTGPTTNNTLWNYTTGGWVLSCAVADGFVYAGSHDFKVYCLKAATGALVWNYTTGDIVWSGPAVVGGLVYSGSNDWKIYCLNATTGALVWNYTTGDAVESEVAVVGGLVYVGSLDKAVYCLNATTGALVWSYTTGGVIIDCPAVVGGLVYVDSGDWKIYCLNATTGTLLWSYTTGSGMDSCPAVVGGLVYVGGLDGKVYCLNAATGAFVWSYTTGGYVDSSPAVIGGLVYVGSWDWKVYCLNATTGALVWSYTTGGVVWGSSPAVAGGLVYVGSNDTKVYCLNAATGALVWSYKTGGLPGHPAVVDVVYVGSEDGVVYAFGEPVAVSISPSSGIMDVGQSQQFTSSVSGGTSPYTYQWYSNGTAMGGATSSTYTFTPTSRDHYNIYVNVTDSVGIAATSNTATVTVKNAPSVTISPTSVTMDLGQSQLFNSSITDGTSPYTYQWYLNDVPVSSATGATWTFTPASSGSQTIYLNVTDAVGLVATSNIATATVNTAPSASISPSSTTFDVGQSKLFTSTVADGTSPYAYQWYLNDVAVSDATNSTWTFTPDSSGSYNIYVNTTDSVNFTVKSNIASVTVNSSLSVTVSPSSAVIDVGQSRQFTSTVNGTSPYTYQWYLNGAPVANATSNNWTFTPTSSDSYTLYLFVTDSADEIAISPASNITVNPIIPEFQPFLFLLLFTIATLLSAILLRKKAYERKQTFARARLTSPVRSGLAPN